MGPSRRHRDKIPAPAPARAMPAGCPRHSSGLPSLLWTHTPLSAMQGQFQQFRFLLVQFQRVTCARPRAHARVRPPLCSRRPHAHAHLTQHHAPQWAPTFVARIPALRSVCESARVRVCEVQRGAISRHAGVVSAPTSLFGDDQEGEGCPRPSGNATGIDRCMTTRVASCAVGRGRRGRGGRHGRAGGACGMGERSPVFLINNRLCFLVQRALHFLTESGRENSQNAPAARTRTRRATETPGPTARATGPAAPRRAHRPRPRAPRPASARSCVPGRRAWTHRLGSFQFSAESPLRGVRGP